MIQPINQRFDHLELVAEFCREINLVETIDEILPKRGEHFLSHGQTVLGMLLNSVGFHGLSLHMFANFYQHKPVEQLIGFGIKAEYFTDDVLGRTLDALFDNNVSATFQTIATVVVKRLGLMNNVIHIGDEYKQETEESKLARLVQSFRQEHRPELIQMVLDLICQNQARLPSYLQALSGNVSDAKVFYEATEQHIYSLKSAQQAHYLVADVAFYNQKTLADLNENKKLFIIQVPISNNLAKKVLLELEQPSLIEIEKGYLGCWVESDYANVKQRWLVIKNEQIVQREMTAFNTRLCKQSSAELKAFVKLSKKAFACEKDAQISLQEFEKKCQLLSFANVKIVGIPVFKKSGRPSKNALPNHFNYQIVANAFSDIAKINEAKSKIGMFILATNELDENALGMNLLLANYKSQQKVEGGFRLLKNPEFLTSFFFLKKAKRVEALLMVMTLSLLIYAALEHKIGQPLANKKEFFPDMPKRGVISAS